jgi:hypothetical protein
LILLILLLLLFLASTLLSQASPSMYTTRPSGRTHQLDVISIAHNLLLYYLLILMTPVAIVPQQFLMELKVGIIDGGTNNYDVIVASSMINL